MLLDYHSIDNKITNGAYMYIIWFITNGLGSISYLVYYKWSLHLAWSIKIGVYILHGNAVCYITNTSRSCTVMLSKQGQF